MKADDAAVAGFFEDLPVLIFVLAGVMVLVLSSVWSSNHASEARAESDLELSAERLLWSVLDCIGGNDIQGAPPSMPSIEGANLTEAAAACNGLAYSIAVVELYPDARWIRLESKGSFDDVTTTGSCSAMLNAIDGFGRVAVVEVRVLVWKD